MCNLLAGKTRILVTHQLQFLKDVDSIVVLAGGSITERGTFSVRRLLLDCCSSTCCTTGGPIAPLIPWAVHVSPPSRSVNTYGSRKLARMAVCIDVLEVCVLTYWL